MIDVCAAIIFSGDRFLIARRGPKKDLSGYWEFPGGKMEPGEDERSCLKREIREELSLDINICNHFINSVFNYTDKTIYLRCFICELSGGEVVATDHDRIEWIVPEELNNYIFAPADVAVAEALKTYFK